MATKPYVNLRLGDFESRTVKKVLTKALSEMRGLNQDEHDHLFVVLVNLKTEMTRVGVNINE